MNPCGIFLKLPSTLSSEILFLIESAVKIINLENLLIKRLFMNLIIKIIKFLIQNLIGTQNLFLSILNLR